MSKYVICGTIVGFIFGALAGGAGVFFYQKRKYEKILAECEGTADTIGDEISKARAAFFEKKEDYEPVEVEAEVYDLADIKEKLKKNKMVTTEYAKMYSAGELVDGRAEAGEPDPEELADGEDEAETESFKLLDEIKKNYGRAPRIVKEEDVDREHEGWDVSSLFLYSNGIVTDEDDNVIEGEELTKMLGDSLTKYNFINSDEKLIYVQCFELNTFYEINKFDKPFEEG